MAELARHAGVPSGSVHHRFPSRAVLLGELWLRTVDRFQEGFLTCLADRDACRGARTAARYVVDWSRANPDSARLLLCSRRDFVPEGWPAGQTARAAAQDRRLRALAGRLEVDLERLAAEIAPDPDDRLSRRRPCVVRRRVLRCWSRRRSPRRSRRRTSVRW
ncbi:TetR/AcrR family transcriptional regulator [Nonomuraea longispora]|uniref:TetR/AcrR family transcriptional regulator n=1 Tax=Nonomuraea longispora TaxID=1848320 RepID=UPI003CCC8420